MISPDQSRHASLRAGRLSRNVVRGIRLVRTLARSQESVTLVCRFPAASAGPSFMGLLGSLWQCFVQAKGRQAGLNALALVASAFVAGV